MIGLLTAAPTYTPGVISFTIGSFLLPKHTKTSNKNGMSSHFLVLQPLFQDFPNAPADGTFFPLAVFHHAGKKFWIKADGLFDGFFDRYALRVKSIL